MAITSEEKHVRKPNSIIQAGQSLTATQQNILFSMLKRFVYLSSTTDIVELSQVTYSIPISEVYLNFEEVKGGKTYDLVRQQVSQLVEQKLTDIRGKETTYVPIFGYAKVTEGASEIKVRFNIEVLPYMVNMIREGYTSLVFKEVYALKSAYAKRLYELIYLNRNAPKTVQTGKFEISVTDFRFKLGIETTMYPRWFDLKKRVVDTAVSEILEKTSLRFVLDFSVQKRIVTALVFSDIMTVDAVAQTDGSIGEQGVLDFTIPPVTADYEIVKPNPLLDGILPKDRALIETQHSEEFIAYYYKKVKNLEEKGRLKSDFANCLFSYMKNDADDFYNRPKKTVKSAIIKTSPEVERRLAERKKVQEESRHFAMLEEQFCDLTIDVQQERISKIKETMLFFSDDMARKQAILEFAKELDF